MKKFFLFTILLSLIVIFISPGRHSLILVKETPQFHNIIAEISARDNLNEIDRDVFARIVSQYHEQVKDMPLNKRLQSIGQSLILLSNDIESNSWVMHGAITAEDKEAAEFWRARGVELSNYNIN